jgi:predicted transcriptional regulator
MISNAKKIILNEMKEIVLFEYYRRNPDFGYNSVIPSTYISEISNFSLYYVRKCIKQLVKEGMLVSDVYVDIPAPWDREYHDYTNKIHRGYCITIKGNEYIESLNKIVFVNGNKHVVNKYPLNETRNLSAEEDELLGW